MQQLKWLPFLYLIGINLWAIIVFGWDKFVAGRGKSRVSERHLLRVMAFGGVLGGRLAMMLFRHKTRKESFLKQALWASVAGVVVFAGIFLLTIYLF